jgi:hypothetical protein
MRLQGGAVLQALRPRPLPHHPLPKRLQSVPAAVNLSRPSTFSLPHYGSTSTDELEQELLCVQLLL